MKSQAFLTAFQNSQSKETIIDSDSPINRSSDTIETEGSTEQDPSEADQSQLSEIVSDEIDEVPSKSSSELFLEERITVAECSDERLFYESYGFISGMVVAFDLSTSEVQKRNHLHVTELLQHHAMLAIAGYLEYDSISEDDQRDLYTSKQEFLNFAWAMTRLWMRFALGEFCERLMSDFEEKYPDPLIIFINSFDLSFLNLCGYTGSIQEFARG
jgi:hypothetical protein